MSDTVRRWSNLVYDASWVLLDVGGVLFHDEPVHLFYLSRVHHHLLRLGALARPDPEDFFRRREELLQAGTIDWIHAFGRWAAGADWDKVVAVSWDETLQVWPRLYVPCEGALEAVAALSAQVRLACVANQPLETEALLAEQGLSCFFQKVLFDAHLGVAKPDERFFSRALEELGTTPDAAIYVGDRLDNDIEGARRLGLTTVWVRRTPRRFAVDGVNEKFATAHAASLDRRWYHNAGTGSSGTTAPDLVVPNLSHLVTP